MKILRVKLTNLNSLRGPHEVDFQVPPLSGTSLFAITGPTGAGKSTLLDAITLALFGKAARYGKDPSPESTMSRHCSECSAEVLFQVPGGIYRAEWRLRRAKASGKVQPAKRSVYDAADALLTQNIGEAEGLIERLVGLDYPRFLRSAMLAQGEFAQFLKAKTDDRAALLESLTGTNVYSELGSLAYREADRRESEVKNKEQLIQQFQLLPDAQREKLIADLPVAQSSLTQVAQDLPRVSELMRKADSLKEALEREDKALRAQDALVGEAEHAKEALGRLSKHRLTVPFQEDLARLQYAELAVTNAGDLLQQSQAEHSKALLKAHGCLHAYRQMVNEQITRSDNDLVASRNKVRQAGEQKTDAENWLKENQADIGLPVKIAALVADLLTLKAARRDLGREWKTLLGLAVELKWEKADEHPRSAEDLSRADLDETLKSLLEAVKAKQTKAADAHKEASLELESREDHLAKAKLVASFETQRAALKKDEPCPLCGSIKHPFAEGAAPSLPFQDLEQRVKAAKQVCRDREKEIHDLNQLQAKLNLSAEKLPNAFDEFKSVHGRLANELTPYSASVPASGTEDQTRTSLQSRADAYRSHAEQAAKAAQDQAAAEAQVHPLEASLLALKEKESTLAGESLPEATDREALPEAPALPRSPSLTATEKDWLRAHEEFGSRATTLQNRKQDKARNENEASRLQAALSARLQGTPFIGLDALKTARLDPAEATRIETIEQSLNTRRAQLEADLRAARESIGKLRQEHVPEGDAVSEIKMRETDLRNQNTQLIQQVTTWQNQLTQDDHNRTAVAAKHKELETDRQRLAVWQKLRGLIGSFDGRTFRRYAQALSLGVLVEYANQHLVHLSDRYRLRRCPGEDLDLEIEDLYQSGAVRPMASLSGGESFLASLALALGLADIAGQNVRIESLFIDEGFGSLDSETLDLAISALEALRQDNKMVGVISHVDLLKERIATQIIVEKQAGGTSSLRLTS